MLTTMVDDVENAYLKAYTQRKVYFIAGSQFDPLDGHTMVIARHCMNLATLAYPITNVVLIK